MLESLTKVCDVTLGIVNLLSALDILLSVLQVVLICPCLCWTKCLEKKLGGRVLNLVLKALGPFHRLQFSSFIQICFLWVRVLICQTHAY